MRAANQMQDPSVPEELPAYAVSRAAQIVRLSPSTLRLWAGGNGDHKQLFVPADEQPLNLSFSNLVEAFVLASIRRVHGISMQKVRKALHLVGTEMGIKRPLIHAQFKTDGKRLFIERAGRLLEASQPNQALLEKILSQNLERIDWGLDVAQRLHPWVRADIGAAQPKSIVIDPRRGFGQPVIIGTGIQARVVAGRYRAGESINELADDYGLSLDLIEDAIRCETVEAA